MRELGGDYDIRKRYQSEVTEADLDEADLIVIYFWFQFESMQALAEAFSRHRHKLVLGVCSHSEIEGSRGEAGQTLLREWGRAVFAVNRQIYRQCQALLNVPVVYAPNGVNTRFFHPGSDRQPEAVMRVGWAGSLLNHGRDHRGYYDFILPAVQSISGVELVTAAREDLWRGPEEMREFYRSLDLYVCASSSEGTPNPCLEAAACGVPLLTTRVGNMPELVVHGVNGFFVDRDIEDFAQKLCLLRDDLPLRTSFAQRIHQDIQQWDWSNRSQAYRKMFQEILLQNSALKKGLVTEVKTNDKSTTDAPPAGTGADEIKTKLTSTAKKNLSLIPAGFFEQHKAIEVTIIMLSHGRLDKTLKALRALRESVRIPFKLLLIDNGSEREVQARLKKTCSEESFIELILLDENLGCAGGRIFGLNHVHTEYVMFLDNDVEVFPGTVEHLLYSLELHPEAVGSSGKVVFPNGLMHLCGADYCI